MAALSGTLSPAPTTLPLGTPASLCACHHGPGPLPISPMSLRVIPSTSSLATVGASASPTDLRVQVAASLEGWGSQAQETPAITPQACLATCIVGKEVGLGTQEALGLPVLWTRMGACVSETSHVSYWSAKKQGEHPAWHHSDPLLGVVPLTVAGMTGEVVPPMATHTHHTASCGGGAGGPTSLLICNNMSASQGLFVFR